MIICGLPSKKSEVTFLLGTALDRGVPKSVLIEFSSFSLKIKVYKFLHF